ncbi:MAG: hypothetical protein H6835_20705 [Planctomycetes bacterium]|nr:hypothetical protein [Planctomycetota bacterium]
MYLIAHANDCASLQQHRQWSDTAMNADSLWLQAALPLMCCTGLAAVVACSLRRSLWSAAPMTATLNQVDDAGGTSATACRDGAPHEPHYAHSTAFRIATAAREAETSVDAVRAAATAGRVDAMLCLGAMRAITRNERVRWLRAAAEAGSGDAFYVLHRYEGSNTSERHARWWLEGARYGSAQATYWLAQHELNGARYASAHALMLRAAVLYEAAGERRAQADALCRASWALVQEATSGAVTFLCELSGAEAALCAPLADVLALLDAAAPLDMTAAMDLQSAHERLAPPHACVAKANALLRSDTERQRVLAELLGSPIAAVRARRQLRTRLTAVARGCQRTPGAEKWPYTDDVDQLDALLFVVKCDERADETAAERRAVLFAHDDGVVET